MNGVEKLYKNAGIDRIEKGYCSPGYCKRHPSKRFENCETCKQCEYGHFYMSPEFTEHKQLELLKWLGELDMLEIMRTTREDKAWIINSEYGMSGNVYKHTSKMKSFEEALAGLIDSLWQSLTEEERKQIKEILE